MPLSSQFKKHAEQIAEEVRADMGLPNIVALDPFRLLGHLDVPWVSLGQLAQSAGDEEVADATAYLRGEESSSLSAMTVIRGTRRIIVYNEGHSEPRRNSDLCHEAAHALLMHESSVAIDDRGCRSWDGGIEKEAEFLGGALLIPGKGARYAAKASWSNEVTAHRFGCSIEMARYRDNVSGGRRIRDSLTRR